MPTNPNKAFADRGKLYAYDDQPMMDTQKRTLQAVMYSKSIPWQSVCVVSLGYNKPMKDLNRGEARSCILKAHVWDNLKRKQS
jgi:hypothetical protein